MNSADYVYVKIKGKDSWCNDAIDYTLTASIDSNDRDTDEDGYIDTEDSCDNTPGTSVYDRKGCVDSDSDGYSDPEVDGDQTMVQMLFLTNHPNGRILIMMVLAII